MRQIPARRALLVGLLAMFACGPWAVADDWPQLLGPQRNGISKESVEPWGDGGPKLLWRQRVGEGYAGVAVSSGLAVAFHREGGKNVVEAWTVELGKPAWRATFDAPYRGGINSDRGPRCAPVIGGGKVYAYSAGGVLACVDLKSGDLLWTRALASEYRALDGYFGAGSTPILVGRLLLLNVGGRDDAELVALDAASGRTVWKHGEDNASYSSPTIMDWEGKPHVVFVTRLHCVGVEPETGKEVFRFRFGQTGPTVNAATPLAFDNHLFLSASYGIGASMYQVGGGKLSPLWNNDNSMSSQYTTCVQRDGALFGIHGREDAGSASLRSVDAKTGKVLWEQDSAVGHLLLAKNYLIVLEVDGRLRLVEPDKHQY
ncbi:MAG: PQQ-binding-like beta-propeller repeat protein, partial [Planctomycetales bacterium]|nr:PQQ-binding-like beta-propeller repeat protein [Planctomycetales bacterium]